ncbi:SMI1/KNR4 family protein [Streptomyces sp. NPDC005925]|uniref:SMI1/KNR4 family protein n=1 Tax=Streptomyces sp. NPDC005925 TaxID=3157172 RepID=UPI0033D0FCD0
MTGRYTVPGACHSVGLPRLHDLLTDLAEPIREERGWDTISWEMDCLPSGEYRLVVFKQSVGRVTSAGGGYQIVLDPACRLPQPGLRQEACTSAPAGDPESATGLFRTYLDRRAAVLGHREELPPPATSQALDAAEQRIGRTLPADLRALYLIADGDAVGLDARYLIDGYTWLSLDSVVREYGEGSQRPWSGWDLEWDAVVFDATPADTVRRCAGHPDWIRFASGEDGNYLAVDMAPARDGRPGQVIVTGCDYDDGPAYVADSVTSLVRDHIDLLEKGAYEYEEEDDYLCLLRERRDARTRQIIGGIPDEVPATLQAIHINDAAGPVDLRPLGAAPGLRLLHLNRSRTADLTPVRDLPVESLRVVLDGGDLTPLAGHPHLTALDVSTTAPADLTPLHSLPHMHGLDLAGADVRDLTVLAGLPNLRYLALDQRQWAVLLRDGKLPPALAAVRLAGDDVTIEDALTLASRLGLDTGAALRVAGTL